MFFLFFPDMTLPKMCSVCPICQRVYPAMSNHLKHYHAVVNVKERRILLNLATNRVFVRDMSCPLLGCSYKSSWLDRHLKEGHPEIGAEEAEAHMNAIRRATTISLLATLRASDPTPPMSSTLDIAGGVDIRLPPAPEASCTNAQYLALLSAWRDRYRGQKELGDRLEKELSVLRLSFKKVSRKLRRQSVMVGLVSEAERIFSCFIVMNLIRS